MPVYPTWPDIALRLLLTLIAGALIGMNRGEHSRPAGLRTTMLVCLTASSSLILGNLLLGTVGRASNAFVTFDVMRLPLGVLTGMGFIGAGAILRKGNLVVGVTTAATLWFTTMMGFCFGAGQLAMGFIMLTLGVFILAALKRVEKRWMQKQEATLVLVTAPEGPTSEEFAQFAVAQGYELSLTSIKSGSEGEECAYQVSWKTPLVPVRRPPLVDLLLARPGVVRLEWVPVANS